jgi:nucleoside-diphosphate-sugar epimerase
VLISSLAAGGPSQPQRPLTGDEPPNPVTRYGRSKLAGEEVVRRADLPWTIIRPPIVYGPGDREMLRIFRAAALGFAPVFGDGSQRLSLVYGPDLAAAIVAAAVEPATVGSVYYPSHRETLSSRELVGAIGRILGKRVFSVGIPGPVGRAVLWTTGTAARLAGRATLLSLDKAAEFLAPAWIVDPARLTEATGWTAAHDFEAGARRTVEWYRQRGWL